MRRDRLTFFLALFIFGLVFPQVVLAAWFDSDYGYCRELTMTAGSADGMATTTTAGFPLTATSTLADLRTVANGGRIEQTSTASGTTTPVDVMFTDGTDCNSDGGTQVLDFYFEKYVPTTGEFAFWVEAPDLSSSVAKSILMYYGSATEVDKSDESGVFGSLREEAVWNFDEDPTAAGAGAILDSTANNNDATDQAMETADQILGMVGGAFDMDGANEWVETAADVNDTEGIANLTLMVWRDVDTLGNWEPIISKCDCDTGGASTGWEWTSGGDAGSGTNDDMAFYPDAGDGSHANTTSSVLDPNAGWQHLVVVYTGGAAAANEITFYVNGAVVAETVSGTVLDTTDSNAVPIGIGQHGGTTGDNEYDGQTDDVRIFTRALDLEDVLTIYNNTSNSELFWDFGTEETETAGGTRVMRLLGNVRFHGVRLLGL